MKVDLSLINADLIREYQENGVCVVRGLISPQWIVRMGEATDRILADPSPGSMEYTPDGKSVNVTGKISENYAVIEIKDEGIGVPHEKREQIFEPFFSLENHKTHSTSQYQYMGGGIGMGLTLARLIAEYHKGKLTLQSEGEGKGTTVSMTFPLD